MDLGLVGADSVVVDGSSDLDEKCRVPLKEFAVSWIFVLYGNGSLMH